MCLGEADRVTSDNVIDDQLAHVPVESQTPVRVAVDQKSCGCLECTVSKSTIAPGENFDVHLEAMPAETSSQQVQQAVIRCDWKDADKEHTERFAASMNYALRFDFDVVPRSAGVGAVVGEPVRLHFFVLDGEGEPDVEHALADDGLCTLPGWRVRRVVDEPMPAMTRHFVLEGTPSSTGIVEGEVRWKTKSVEQPVVVVPVRVRGLSPLRTFPGGACFVIDPDHAVAPGAEEKFLSLIAREADAPKPMKVIVEPETAPVQAEILAGGKLRVRLLDEARRSSGAARCRVLDDAGNQLCDVPVAWYRATHPRGSSAR